MTIRSRLVATAAKLPPRTDDLQNSRGTFGSSGRFVPFQNDSDDGAYPYGVIGPWTHGSPSILGALERERRSDVFTTSAPGVAGERRLMSRTYAPRSVRLPMLPSGWDDLRADRTAITEDAA
ncbi:hypothetical protein [Microbacterium sp. NPDC097977]|uniref:hypothetical protein n=1 Tax=Microbacterium sp. NPDC097977 TaxID=3155686 RepID=UPI00332E2927